MLLALQHQEKGLSKFNTRFFHQLMGKKSNETTLQAIRRTQKELKEGDQYVDRFLEAIKTIQK